MDPYLRIFVGLTFLAGIVGAGLWVAGLIIHFNIQKFRRADSQAMTILVWDISEYLAAGHAPLQRSKRLMNWGYALFVGAFCAMALALALHLLLLP